MCNIDNRGLANMKSPARHVFRYLHSAIINLAPEHKHKLEEFTLIYCDTHQWVLDVNVFSREIRISRRVVEIVWSAAYAYPIIHNGAVRVQDPFKQADLDLTKNIRVENSCKLLEWAYGSWLNEDDSDWPKSRPMPIDNPAKGTDEYQAEQLSHGALGFMLHHELAHIRLGHDSQSNIEQERDADYAAIDWIFEKVDRSNVDLINDRALSCAIGLAVICAHDIHTRNFGGSSHPPSYDRLVHGLRHALGDDEHHAAWFLVNTILRLHMTSAGMPISSNVYRSPYECVEDMADQLSRETISIRKFI